MTTVPFKTSAIPSSNLRANIRVAHLRSSELHTDPDSIPFSKEFLDLVSPLHLHHVHLFLDSNEFLLMLSFL